MSRIIYSIETLIVNTICIHGNTGNIHIRGIFFVAFIGADYNRCLWIYKVTRFNYCFGSGRVEGGLMWSFERSQEGGLPESNKCEQGRRGGPNFGHFVRT